MNKNISSCFYLWWVFLIGNIFLILVIFIGLPLSIFVLIQIQDIITMNTSLGWNIFLNRNNLSNVLIFIQLFISFSIFSTCFAHLKESHLMNQIIVNYKKMPFLLITCLFFFILNVCCTLYGFSWYCVFNVNNIKNILTPYKKSIGDVNIDVMGVLLSNLLNTIMCMVLGLLLAMFCKSNMVRTTFTCIFLGMATLLSGCFIPFVWYHGEDWFNAISYLSPFRYTSALMQMSWSSIHTYNLNGVNANGGIWDASHAYSIYFTSTNNNSLISQALNPSEIIVSWIMPIAIIIVSTFTIIYCPKWKII